MFFIHVVAPSRETARNLRFFAPLSEVEGGFAYIDIPVDKPLA